MIETANKTYRRILSLKRRRMYIFLGLHFYSMFNRIKVIGTMENFNYGLQKAPSRNFNPSSFQTRQSAWHTADNAYHTQMRPFSGKRGLSALVFCRKWCGRLPLAIFIPMRVHWFQNSDNLLPSSLCFKKKY